MSLFLLICWFITMGLFVARYTSIVLDFWEMQDWLGFTLSLLFTVLGTAALVTGTVLFLRG